MDKIVHFFVNGSGGAIRSAIDLANATKDMYEHIFVFIEKSKDFEFGFKKFYLTNSRKFYKKLDILGDMILAYKLKNILNKTNPKAVISHVESSAKVLRWIDMDKIYYIRANIIEELKEIKNISKLRYLKRKLLYKRLINKQVVLTVSKELKNNILKEFSPKKIECIYTPFNKENIIAKSKEFEVLIDNYIITPTASFKIKRADIMLKAFSKVKEDVKLLIIGASDKEKEKLLNLAKNLNIKDKIIIKPHQKNPYPYIKNAKLLVLTSQREGLPRVLVESLILKTPVVSTNCPTGPKEVLVGELSNYLAKVNDVDDIAKKIELALKYYPPIKDGILKKFDEKEVSKKFFEFLNN